MKKLSTLLLCLFVSIAAIGQFEWVYDNGFAHEYVHKFMKTKKNQYAVLHGQDDYCCPTQLTVLDSAGILVFNYIAQGASTGLEIIHFTDIVEMPDSSISLTTVNGTFDPVSMQGFEFSAVLHLDANWNPARLAEDFTQYHDIGAPLSDGGYILLDVNNNKISRKSAGGDEIWQKGLPGYIIFDMVTTGNDTILIGTGQGLIVMDEDGNMVAGYPFLVFNQIKTNGQDGIIGVNADSAYLLSPEYSLLAAIGHQGDNIKDFSVEDGMIAVLTSSGYVYRYDASLSPLNDFQLFNDGEFRHIAIGAERLVLAGMERYGGPDVTEGTRTVFVKEYSFEGDGYGLSKDIGVIGVAQPQEIQVVNSGSNFKVIFKNIKVMVKNFGNNSVESLYLRSQQFKSNMFNNLGLAPGDEVELTIDAIERTFASDPAGLELNLCFWTSHPDLLMDLDASNDSYCADFLVNNKDVLVQNSFKLFPNPAHDMLNLLWQGQFASNDATCRIINAEGKVIKQMGIENQQGFVSISVEDWQPGVYFIQIFADEPNYLERFVVIK